MQLLRDAERGASVLPRPASLVMRADPTTACPVDCFLVLIGIPSSRVVLAIRCEPRSRRPTRRTPANVETCLAVACRLEGSAVTARSSSSSDACTANPSAAVTARLYRRRSRTTAARCVGLAQPTRSTRSCSSSKYSRWAWYFSRRRFRSASATRSKMSLVGTANSLCRPSRRSVTSSAGTVMSSGAIGSSRRPNASLSSRIPQ
jgi:hypothetical protein